MDIYITWVQNVISCNLILNLITFTFLIFSDICYVIWTGIAAYSSSQLLPIHNLKAIELLSLPTKLDTKYKVYHMYYMYHKTGKGIRRDSQVYISSSHPIVYLISYTCISLVDQDETVLNICYLLNHTFSYEAFELLLEQFVDLRNCIYSLLLKLLAWPQSWQVFQHSACLSTDISLWQYLFSFWGIC